MRNIRLRVAYDGTEYSGWQFQQNAPSIQGTLEAAISQMTGEKVQLIGAGRTDAGVHAVGQVANFLTNSTLPAYKFARGLDALVPPSIRVLEAEEVPFRFHAQFQAIRKRYRYVIDNHRVPLPFSRFYSFNAYGELDNQAMHTAGQHLLGKHDFRSFETNYPNKASSVRTIEEVTVKRVTNWPVTWPDPPPSTADQQGHFVAIDVVADGFLYNMVRAITGTLLDVGWGKKSVDDVRMILTAMDRRLAGQTAPPQGLYLMQVDYPPVT